MNDKTGEIRQMTPEEAAELNRAYDENPLYKGGCGKWVPLTETEARIVGPMSRAERRRWLREARRNGAKPS